MRALKYVVAIHVPVYVDGSQCFLATDWMRSIRLLRDSFGGGLSQLILVAPQYTVNRARADQQLTPVDQEAEGLTVVASMAAGGRARTYWLRERAKWKADVARHMIGADVAHVGLGDLFQPVNWDAFTVARKHAGTVVFVRDTDEIAKMRQLDAKKWATRLPGRVYERVYDNRMKACVSKADLSLLKGRLLFNRYEKFALNPKLFHNTSYLKEEIVSLPAVERRLAGLSADRPLRLVYCGRLEARKGVDHAVEMVARARAMGAKVEFDIIGDGRDAGTVRALIEREGAGEFVKLCGTREYGPELLHELSAYDAFLYTPLGEDTPRAIFDGYAAGLPLIGYGIEYVKERAQDERATVVLPFRDKEAGAAALAKLDRDRSGLADMARLAHRAAHDNAADVWYRRRADWTLEAVERNAGAPAKRAS